MTPARSDSSANLPCKKKSNPRSAKNYRQACRKRQANLRQWLIAGISSEQIEAQGSVLLQKPSRQVQQDIHKIVQDWADEASRSDHLAGLWLAKSQREHLLQKAMQKLEQCDDKDAARWQSICHLHLRERDSLLGKIANHRKRSGRDTSPDSEQARPSRQGLITLAAQQWEKRLEHHRHAVIAEMRQRIARACQLNDNDAAKLQPLLDALLMDDAGMAPAHGTEAGMDDDV